AAHAAEGYAYVTGRPGVCIATSGPGATNLVTGIMDAMIDSVTMVAITGQVHAHLLGTDAFQEADIIGITTPITKWNCQVTRAEDIPEAIAKAFHIAKTGRPGPVVVDITKNAQIDSAEFVYPKKVHIESFQPVTIPNAKQIKLAAELINNAKRPYLLAGHGILISHAVDVLRTFVEKSGVPVGSTLLGLSGFPTAHPLYAGMLGMHGNYGPNVLANRADVVIAVGMRFDDRVTGRLSDYLTNAHIIHIDIDPAELNKNVRAEVPIVADAKSALTALLPLVKKREHTAWVNEFKKCMDEEKKQVIHDQINPKAGKITMAEAVHSIAKATKGDAVVVADVGQHQMAAARYYPFARPHSWITSGGAGTMGFALPAAMGAKFGAPKREVIAIIGDGGFQMTIQELGTIAQEQLPVKIIILNNDFLGMVRQWQQLFFDKRYSFVNLKNPDFVMVAKGFHIKGEKITKREDLGAALKRTFAQKGPYLLEIEVEKEGNIFPMVSQGASVDEIRLK
ncbi:biosynthetic-type acetolactate synthase large subunit, partial [Candidatus Microgenomates bacterium]|nr:biosynthetic-type acetolactate synthase large subunit [Candidatus Microgenomates bacterium]